MLSRPPGSCGNPLTHSSLQSLLPRAGCLPKYLSIPAPRPGPKVHPFRPLDLTRLFRGLPAAFKAPPIHFLPTGHRGFSRAQICTWTLRSPCLPSPVSRLRARTLRPPNCGSRLGMLQWVPPRAGGRALPPLAAPGPADPGTEHSGTLGASPSSPSRPRPDRAGPEKADSRRSQGGRAPRTRGARGWGCSGGWARPTGATGPAPWRRHWPRPRGWTRGSPRSAAPLCQGPDLAAPGGWARRGEAAPQVGAGRAGAGPPRSPDGSLWHPVPRSHAGRALTLPRGARLPGGMDAALLYSLLEANCSLALAEELLLDGWGLPLDPEGRRRRAERAARVPSPAC